MSLTDTKKLSNPASRLIAAALIACLLGGPAGAAEKVAVFEFEIVQGSAVPGAPDHHEAEEQRLRMIGQRLREHLAKSGKFQPVDITSVAEKARASNLQACGNCADGLARNVGASYAFTGTVHKVSELILSINVYVHEAATSKPVTGASVDLRGNTDESWRRGIDYLYKNVLSSRLEKLLK